MLADEFCNAIVGASVTDIRRQDFTWFFYFDCGWTISAESWWRVLTRDGIAACDEDDQQFFGNAEPLDASQVARETLATSAARCRIDVVSGDLEISFRDGAVLQVFNNSCAYEGWQASNGPSRSLVAMGGGRVIAV